MNMLYRFFTSQKGAMFGLDARLTIAILAALSVIVGVAVNFNSNDARAVRIYSDIKSVSDAWQRLLEDIDLYPITRVTNTVGTIEPVSYLLSDIDFVPQRKVRWHGPYLTPDIIYYDPTKNASPQLRSAGGGPNNTRGAISIGQLIKNENGYSSHLECHTLPNCYTIIAVYGLTLTLAEAVEKHVDGPLTGSSPTTGRLHYLQDGSEAGYAIIYFAYPSSVKEV